jgi:hypothetical protein
MSRRSVLADDLFGVGGEPDDPAMRQEEERLRRRQQGVHRPGNERLSGANPIRGQPLRMDYHGRILSAHAPIGKSLLVNSITEVCILYETALAVVKLIHFTYRIRD